MEEQIETMSLFTTYSHSSYTFREHKSSRDNGNDDSLNCVNVRQRFVCWDVSMMFGVLYVPKNKIG